MPQSETVWSYQHHSHQSSTDDLEVGGKFCQFSTRDQELRQRVQVEHQVPPHKTPTTKETIVNNSLLLTEYILMHFMYHTLLFSNYFQILILILI